MKHRNYGLEEALGTFKPHEGETNDFMAKFRKKKHEAKMREAKIADIVGGVIGFIVTCSIAYAVIKIILL